VEAPQETGWGKCLKKQDFPFKSRILARSRNPTDKGKPSVRMGRKTTGLPQSAGLPGFSSSFLDPGGVDSGLGLFLSFFKEVTVCCGDFTLLPREC
jgi:hypothetical protein